MHIENTSDDFTEGNRKEIFGLFHLDNTNEIEARVQSLADKGLLDVIVSGTEDLDTEISTFRGTLLKIVDGGHVPDGQGGSWYNGRDARLKTVAALARAGVPYEIQELEKKRKGEPYSLGLERIVSNIFYSTEPKNIEQRKPIIDSIFETLARQEHPTAAATEVNHSQRDILYTLSRARAYPSELRAKEGLDSIAQLIAPKKTVDVIKLLNIPLQDPAVLLTLLGNGDIEGAKQVIQEIGGIPKSLLLVEPGYYSHPDNRMPNILAILNNPETLRFIVSQGVDLSQTATSKGGKPYNIWDILISQTRQNADTSALFHTIKTLVQDFHVPLNPKEGSDPLTALLRHHKNSFLVPTSANPILSLYQAEDIQPKCLAQIAQLPNDSSGLKAAIIGELIKKGIDINQQFGPKGLTLLHVAACDQGSSRLVFSLLEHGADINMADHEGNTALMYAVQGMPTSSYHTGTGDSTSAKILLHMGADPNARNNQEQSVSDMLVDKYRLACNGYGFHDRRYNHDADGYQAKRTFQELATTIVRHGGNSTSLVNSGFFNSMGLKMGAALHTHRNGLLARSICKIPALHPQRYTRQCMENLQVGIPQETVKEEATAPSIAPPLTPVEYSPAMQESLRKTAELDREIAELENAFAGKPRQKPPGSRHTGHQRRTAKAFANVGELIQRTDSPDALVATGTLLEGVISRSTAHVERTADQIISRAHPEPTQFIKELSTKPAHETHGDALKEERSLRGHAVQLQ